MNSLKAIVKVDVAWLGCLQVLRWFAAHFDMNDAHFYAGMVMLFCGLWLTASLGLALLVCGGIVAAVGFVSALLGIILPMIAAPRKGKG